MAISSIRIEHESSHPLAVVRLQASAAELGTVVPHSCGLVWSFLRANNLRGGRNVALYWDDAIRLEVGVEFPDAMPEDREVVPSATPAGKVAAVTHFGPYTELGEAHGAIHRWASEHHERLAGPFWEVYGHWETAWNTNPQLIRADVCYLLTAAGHLAG